MRNFHCTTFIALRYVVLAFLCSQVIDKVKRAAVVDGDEVSHQEDAFTVSAFLEALKEEAAGA